MLFYEFIHDRSPYHPIAREPWKSNSSECSAGFRIAHFDDRPFIKYKALLFSFCRTGNSHW